MNDAKLIYDAYDSCIRKIERVKLMMEMEESVNGIIALTFELGCVLRDLRKQKEELEREVAVLSRLRKKIINEALKAFKFEPKSKQILEVLLFSYAKLKDFSNSLVYLNKLKKMNYMEDNIYKNISADLNYLKGLEYLEKEKNK